MKILIILLLLPLLVFANTYKVQYVKGNITKNKKNIKIGSILETTDLIEIDKDSKIIMISKKEIIIRCEKSGIYSIAKLEALSNTKNSNVSKEFAQSILNELNESEDLLASGNINNNMQTLGAVERSTTNKLYFYDNVSTYVIDETYKFTWNYTDSVTFNIKNIDGDILYEKSTTENNIIVNLNDIGLESGICHFFSISQGNNISEEYCIYKMTSNELIIFKQDYTDIVSNMNLDNSIDYLILAKFYEKNKMIDKACYNYEKAINLDTSSLYKVLYKNYLLNIGLFEKANSIKF